MAVVSTHRVTIGTGLTGKFGESFVFTEKWKVRVDSPATSKVLISRAPGVKFGDPHWDFADHKAMEFSCDEASGDGMAWVVTVNYYIPPKPNTPDPSTGVPKDYWAATGGTATIPAWKDNAGVIIANSAGDPLEGLEMESSDYGLTLTKCYTTWSGWSADAVAYSNKVNSVTWPAGSAGTPRTWRAIFKGAVPKELSVTATSGANTTQKYWETTWEFLWRADTWDLKPWDVGFNQLVNSSGTPTAGGTLRAAILGADKKPVKQPVALSSGIAKTAGQKPDALTFQVYKTADFSSFGTPA